MVEANELSFREDSIVFRDAMTDSIRVVQSKEVESVLTNHRGRGVLEFMAAAGIVGLFTDVLVIRHGWREGEGKGIGLFWTTGVSLCGGMIVGAILGHPYRLVMPSDSQGSLDANRRTASGIDK
jgi:hypothetical protein